jgi:hypothetical protein
MAKSVYVLPEMEHEFDIQVKGKESGLNWTGKFKYRRPNIGAQGRIDVSRAKLNQDMATISPQTDMVHTALAHLMHTLIETPDWWKDADFGANLYDHNVVLHVYDKAMSFEEEWQKKVHGGNPEEVDVNAPNKKNSRSKRSAESAR